LLYQAAKPALRESSFKSGSDSGRKAATKPPLNLFQQYAVYQQCSNVICLNCSLTSSVEREQHKLGQPGSQSETG
jgi:hypothetical protein